MCPLTKSIILTTVGYIVGTLGQFLIYPLFGLSVNLMGCLTLGLIFCAIALISNYFTLKAIEYFERRKNDKSQRLQCC